MIESIKCSFPAACREFIIPADPRSESGAGAGIRRSMLDSHVSSAGQARQARNDEPEQKMVPRGKPLGSSFLAALSLFGKQKSE